MEDSIVLAEREKCSGGRNRSELTNGEQNVAFDLVDETEEDGRNENSHKIEVLDENQTRKVTDEFQNQINVQYAVDDVPPWFTIIFMALQHFLLMFSGILSTPLVLAGPLCIQTPLALTKLIGTSFFLSGLVTLLQTTFGVRLPIVQGGTAAFLLPTFAILDQRGPCIEFNAANATAVQEEQAEAFWHGRIREIQGVIIVASLLQVLLGVTGLTGVLLRFIGPLTIVPTISLIGFSLFEVAERQMSTHWGISIFTTFLIGFSSQVLNKYQIPLPRNRNFPIFSLFSIIISITISWTLCSILTFCDVFPDDPDAYGYLARVDVNLKAIEQSTWFRIPYPFQWGIPTFSIAGTLGMIAAVMASVIESIGDYYACARLSGAPPPPRHAVNRGVAVEGVGGILAGILGTGNGTTSFSSNVGAIGLTKVGSRSVIQVTGIMLIIVGIVGKLNGFFSSVPTPVIGGVLAITIGMVAMSGLSNLQFVDLNSSRNLFILGLSFFLGMSIPNYVRSQDNAINTGVDILDQIITVLLGTGMFVGGVTGMILDNLLRGSQRERGILTWKESFGENEQGLSREEKQQIYKPYELPFASTKLRNVNWCRFLPICPTFEGFQFSKKVNSSHGEKEREEEITSL